MKSEKLWCDRNQEHLGVDASCVTIPYVQNFTSKLSLRSALFSLLVWVVFLAIRRVTALSGGFPLQTWWLSITNMMAMQTQKRVVVCTLTLFLAICHSLLGKAVNNFLTHYSNNDLSKDNCCLLNCCLLR